jgi:dihydroneopterin aldolase
MSPSARRGRPEPSGDRILIEGLEIRTVLGVNEVERRAKRIVRVDMEIACDAAAAAKSDDISRATDYSAITYAVEEFVERSGFRLLETLADGIAGLILEKYSAPWVRVVVEKPGALPGVSRVAVVVERGTPPR